MKSNSILNSIVRPLLLITFLAIDIYILVTTLDMQKSNYECKCAQVWYLKQVSNSIITIISLQLIIFVLAAINGMAGLGVLSTFISLLSVAILIVQLYYVIMMMGLIGKLDTIKCVCVNPGFKSFLTYYAGFKALMAIFLIIGLSMIVVSTFSKK
jgi:hypothetical protein